MVPATGLSLLFCIFAFAQNAEPPAAEKQRLVEEARARALTIELDDQAREKSKAAYAEKKKAERVDRSDPGIQFDLKIINQAYDICKANADKYSTLEDVQRASILELKKVEGVVDVGAFPQRSPLIWYRTKRSGTFRLEVLCKAYPSDTNVTR